MDDGVGEGCGLGWGLGCGKGQLCVCGRSCGLCAVKFVVPPWHARECRNLVISSSATSADKVLSDKLSTWSRVCPHANDERMVDG